MGLLSKRNSKSKMENPNPVSVSRAPGEKERETLRAKHRVRLITDAEEGWGVDHLPGGVYGFTSSPGTKNSPLFVKRIYQSFEVHRTAGANVCLVGFVSPEIAARLETGKEDLHIRLFSDPQGDATAVVAIPSGRILRVKEYSDRQREGLSIELGRAE